MTWGIPVMACAGLHHCMSNLWRNYTAINTNERQMTWHCDIFIGSDSYTNSRSPLARSQDAAGLLRQSWKWHSPWPLPSCRFVEMVVTHGKDCDSIKCCNQGNALRSVCVWGRKRQTLREQNCFWVSICISFQGSNTLTTANNVNQDCSNWWTGSRFG